MAQLLEKQTDTLSNQEESLKKTAVGPKYGLEQVADTIYFEFQKNLKKTLIMFGIFAAIFLLFLIVQEVQVSQGMEKPEEALAYLRSYLMLLDMLVLISAVSYGGSMIAVDFEKHTGNLLFPKITRGRLMLGRFIGLYFLNALALVFYFMLVGLTTFFKYDEIPEVLWTVMAWTLLYALASLSFVAMFSSLMKSTSAAVVVSIMFLIILFSIIESIVALTTSIEPLFLLNYYSRIFGTTLNQVMPDPRYMEMEIPLTGEDTLIMRQWLTPSAEGALWGMITYTVVCLSLAYFRFMRRQMKNS